MHVASASLRNGNSFAIAGATPTLPFDLAPGKTLTLTIDVLAHKNGFYRDQLQLTTDHALTTTNFDLEAVYNDKVASVTMANESGVTIRVSPNPSSGSISIETSARSLSVEIVDVTGKIIATHQGGSSWKWDGTHSGVSVPNGTYLVRLAWSDASGRPFSEVRSVAIER